MTSHLKIKVSILAFLVAQSWSTDGVVKEEALRDAAQLTKEIRQMSPAISPSEKSLLRTVFWRSFNWGADLIREEYPMAIYGEFRTEVPDFLRDD